MSRSDEINPDTGEIMQSGSVGGSGFGATAGDLISQGEQLLQIRTKNQLLIAVQRPRNLQVFEKKLLSIAAEAGEDFFYSIPYKEHVYGCSRRGCQCPQTLVEGPGVGLARSAASLFGNCSVDTRIEQETSDAFLVRSDWVDFESNYTRSETKRVSKLLPKRGGGTRLANGKELDLVYQQGASKVERDVIVRSLPKHIIERAFEIAKAAALQEKAQVAQQVARLLRRFGEISVTLAQIEAYIGCPFNEKGMTEAGKDARDVCAHLRGVLTAVKGGDATVEEVFGQKGQEQAQAPASQAPGAIKPEDLAPSREEPRPSQSSAPPWEEPSSAPAPSASPTASVQPAPVAPKNGGKRNPFGTGGGM